MNGERGDYRRRASAAALERKRKGETRLSVQSLTADHFVVIDEDQNAGVCFAMLAAVTRGS